MAKNRTIMMSGPCRTLERDSPSGLTFLEVMISIFLLASLLIFSLPFFVTSRRATSQEGMIIKATQVSQGIIDRIKLAAHAVDSEGNSCYDVLHQIYDPITAPDLIVNNVLLKDTPFIPERSYVVVYPEKTGGSPPDDIAKRVIVHLEWRESHSGVSTFKSYTSASFIARPAVSFPRDPSSAAPPAGFTITTAISAKAMLSTSIYKSNIAPSITQLPATNAKSAFTAAAVKINTTVSPVAIMTTACNTGDL